MTFALKAKVGTKGQAVIPKAVRDELGIRPGDEVAFSTHDGHIHVSKVEAKDPEQAWEEFFTAFPKRNGPLPTAKHLKADFLRQYDKRARRAGLRP